jgi:hypothetical protein
VSNLTRTALIAGGMILLIAASALVALLVTVQGPTPPPVDDFAVTVPACAPAGDTYAGDGDPGGSPCDGG